MHRPCFASSGFIADDEIADDEFGVDFALLRIFSGFPYSVRDTSRTGSRRSAPGMLLVAMVLAVCAMASLDSCRKPKEVEKNPKPITAKDSAAAAQDTSKSFISQQYDSLSHKFTDFFSSLLPRGSDTTKGVPIVTTPPPDLDAPAVTPEVPVLPGFLNTPIKRKIEFDTNGNVIEHDMFLGSDVRTPTTTTLDDYLQQQEDQTVTSGFETAMHKQIDTGKTVDQQTGLLGDYNTISIPIPPAIVPTIFGRPSINLKVSGDVGIHLAYRDQETYATAGANFYGSERGLDFKQEINISTNGTIGDKLKIGADWGSDRMFQYDNLLKFNYQGYPDEILQEFDAGNVTFNPPSQYIAPQQDLFGLKAIMRFGPLYVTALAAQKKGSRQSKSFGGGAGAATEHLISPWLYKRNRFFLDTSFIKYYEPAYSTIPEGGQPLVQNGTVEVWTTTNQPTNLSIRPAVAYYSLGAGNGGYSTALRNSATRGDSIIYGHWIKMDTTRYTVDWNTGVLILSQEPEDVSTSLAVSYTTATGVQYGDKSTYQNDTPLVLKLIKPYGTFTNVTAPSWNNVLKNTYYLGGIGFDPSNFSGRIILTAPGGHQVEYLTELGGKLEKAVSVMGLDRYNNSSPSDKSPDGLIDYSSQFSNTIVDPKTGTLIFPYLQPFGATISNFNLAAQRTKAGYKDTNFYLPEIYNTPQSTLVQRETKLVNIDVKYTGGVSSTLNLGAFNLVEGSVRVTIGGTQLVEGTDFRVDYNSGTVTILNSDLINTGQVNVEYDVHDVFSNATKNVLGFRAEVPLFDEEAVQQGDIGITAMNYSASLPTLKTRQGEEPFSNWILGADGGYKFDAPFLTDAMNALPLFNLKDKSSLNVKVDAALSLPNPNTDVSPMPVDNGASIAYLDDFEGGLNEFPLYLNYGRWVPASQPMDSLFQAQHPAGNNPDTSYWTNPINALKGQTAWFPPTTLPGGVFPNLPSIKPNEQTTTTGQTATTMDYYFDPTKPGIYNPIPSALGTRDNWGGMMQYAPGLNVAATNTDAIQFYVKIDQLDQSDEDSAKLRFDLGIINDDIIPDKKLETEDVAQNGRYQTGEDVGLDGLTDAQEQAKFTSGLTNNTDPSNDDYGVDYLHINGQEGNENDAFAGLTPDHEDLDASGSVNLSDAYYEYEIPLKMALNKYVIGGNPSAGWYQLRIPLADYKRIVGTQDSTFSNISYYRLWTKDVTHPIQLELFEFMMVGSQWTRGTVGLNPTNPIADTSLKIDYVNIWDNSDAGYQPPPGAATTLQPAASGYIPGNEQSLLMHVSCIEDKGEREAQRLFPTPNDLFNYQSMAIWVHGDDHANSEISNSPLTTIKDTLNRVWVYWRIGSDQYDYYEYRRPLVRGWQNIHVDFNTFTNIKVKRPSDRDTSDPFPDPSGVPGATYIVVGSPTFTNAPYFVLGMQNETHQSCLTTDLWWDELRLLDANSKPGIAWSASSQLKLAEFGNITASIADQGADFHQVDEQFNTSRSTSFNWNVTGVFAMDKMLPQWMIDKGSKLPLTISHAESIITPEYIVNTDVNLASAISSVNSDNTLTAARKTQLVDSLTDNNQTLQVKNSIGMNDIALRFPGTFFLLPLVVNRLDFGFGYTEAFMRSPQYEYDYTFGWTVSGRYSLPPLPKLGLQPLTWWGTTTPIIGPYSQWKIDLLPSNVSFAIAATRGREHSLEQLSTLTLPPEGSDSATILAVLNSRVPLVNRVFTATRGMQIDWKPFEGGILSPSFNYALDVTSNLSPLETSTAFNAPTTYDGNGNPIYNYDSIYYYQRSFHDILNDVFFKDGQLARLGEDFSASQRVHMSTSPKLPGLFGLEKLVKPVFDYQVTYKWLNSQSGLQNAKQGAWNNTITTGLEFNVRDLGAMIFGKPAAEEAPQRGQHGREHERNSQVGITPEELPDRGSETRESAPPSPRDQLRNQVERGEEMRPQSRPNPLGRSTYITDTLRHTTASAPPVDTIGKIHSAGIGTEGINDREFVVDTTLTPEAPPVTESAQPELAQEKQTDIVKQILQSFIQKPLFDWNGTRFNFTQTNASLNNALQGDGSGITNFLTRGFFAPENDQDGPSRAYQLGLITDPSGRLLFHWQNRFPFLWYSVRPGLRAGDPFGGNVDVTDAFTETNNFELSTSRPLWNGASISLNWKLSFGFDERDALNINSAGDPTILYQAKSGDISRTFFSIPPFLGLNIFSSGIANVGKKYDDMVTAAGAVDSTARFTLPTAVHNKIEQDAFMQGFETLPFFQSALREYLPRLNYSFTWSGLEKFPLFSFADHASFRDAYSGTYRRSFRQDPGDTLDLTSMQTIVYGFRPLIAFDMSWDKLWNGKLTTSVNYDTQTEWAADYASTRITQRLSTTFGITANYSRQGLSLPFFKVNLKNEFTASFTLSETISSDNYYNFWTISQNPGGISDGGLTKTTIEPRIGYSLSQQLTMEMFYHYERTTPAASGLISPPTLLVEAGFDIKLKIQ